MHIVWSIAELQQLILSHCMSDSLSAIARTSKALKDPALDSLWANTMTHITRLLSLLPSDIQARDISSGTARELVSTDLVAFNSYAKRVTHVDLSSIIPPQATIALMRYLPKPIFPNLRSLTLDFAGSNAKCDFIIQLLGPHVTSIELDNCFRMGDQSAIAFFSYIGSFHPSIGVFRTTMTTHPRYAARLRCAVVEEALGAAIVKLTAPSHITVTKPNHAAMAHIADSKTIQSLCIQYPTHGAIQPLLTHGPTQFTNLSGLSLTVSQCGLPSVCYFISAIPPEQLRSFSLQIHDSITSPHEWQMLLQELARHHSSTMQTLSVVYEDQPESCTLPSVLESLLVMHNLTDIKCHYTTIDFDDDDVEAMATTWPNLRRLNLNTTVTSTGFASLTKHCPELEDLEIHLDDNLIEWGSNKLEEITWRWQHLRKLHLITGITPARFVRLVECCPNLEELIWWSERCELEEFTVSLPHLRKLDLHVVITPAAFADLAKSSPKLEELEISVKDNLETVMHSDHQLQEMILTWPHLWKLHIDVHIPLVTFAGLLRCCPRLKELKISLNVQIIDNEWLNQVMQDDTCNRSLTHLSVVESHPENAMDVADIAEFFIKVVPNVHTIELSYSFKHSYRTIDGFFEESDRDLWEAVCHRLSHLRTVSGRVGHVSFKYCY